MRKWIPISRTPAVGRNLRLTSIVLGRSVLRLREEYRRNALWMFVAATGTAGLVLLTVLQFSLKQSETESGGQSPPLMEAAESTLDQADLPIVDSIEISSEEQPVDAESSPVFMDDLEEPELRANPFVEEEHSGMDDGSIELEIEIVPVDAQADEENRFLVTSRDTLKERFSGWSSSEDDQATSDSVKQISHADDWSPFDDRREPGHLLSTTNLHAYNHIAVVSLARKPNIDFAVQMPKQLSLGDLCSIEFTVTNRGSVKLAGLLLRTDLSPELSHRLGRALDYDIGSLAPGESRTARLHARATSVGQATHRAEILLPGGFVEKVSNNVAISASPLP